MGTEKGHETDQHVADGLRARLHEIAYRDTATTVTVRAGDLRAILAAVPRPHEVGSAPRFELRNGQVAQLFDFGGTPPVGTPLEDQDMLVIQHAEAGHSGPGLYAHYEDMPEEGAIFLDGVLSPRPKKGAPVTAAPGIDLTPLWRLSDAWLKEPEGERQSPGENRLRWAMAKELRDALTLLDASVIDASHKGGSEAVEPDTFFVMGCPGYPGGYSVYPNTMQNALKFIAEHGNEHTTLATWCRQYQRRDYTAQEVRALLASDAEVRP